MTDTGAPDGTPAPPPGKAGAPVYLAGPMFSDADKWQQNLIDRTLNTAGYQTYVGMNDGIEVAAVIADATKGLALPANQVAEIVTFVHQIVFALDVYQLAKRCKSVVFTMDGRVPDDGSISETAIAYATNTPVVIFKTSPITMLGNQDNPMVQGLSTKWAYVDKVAAIPSALDAAVAAESGLSGPGFQAGPRLAATITLGEAIWNQIDMIRQVSGASPAQIYTTVKQMEAQLRSMLDAVFLP
jgi:nucleoside 2-deoxyribosyltransferase